MAKLIQVIEMETMRGLGVEHNPIRTVTQWWTTDGQMLAELDPFADLVLDHHTERYIRQRLQENPVKDHACRQCVGDNAMMPSSGFVCLMHRLEQRAKDRSPDRI